MAESILGTKAVSWGLATGATGTGVGTFDAQSSSFAAESDIAEFRNNKGQVIGEVLYNQRHTLTMEIIPTGTTIALAKAANILPAPGAVINVTDTEDTEVSGTNGGKYVLIRASKQKSNTDYAKITMEMRQYVENDTAVVVAAA